MQLVYVSQLRTNYGGVLKKVGFLGKTWVFQNRKKVANSMYAGGGRFFLVVSFLNFRIYLGITPRMKISIGFWKFVVFL